MFPNTILAKNQQGKKALSLGLAFPNTHLVEYAARAGFDAVNLDGEHGAFNPTDVDRIVHVAHAHGLSVTARVPHIRADEINRWLDRGVQGIMAPHIETADQTRALVDACYFAPLGQRSWGGGRGTEFNDEAALASYGGRPGFRQFADDNMLVFAQIESQLGYDNLDAILAIKGLDAIAFGPNDLAASLGFPGAPADHPEVVRVHADIEARTRAAGKRISLDYAAQANMSDLLIDATRAFAATHADEPFPPA